MSNYSTCIDYKKIKKSAGNIKSFSDWAGVAYGNSGVGVLRNIEQNLSALGAQHDDCFKSCTESIAALDTSTAKVTEDLSFLADCLFDTHKAFKKAEGDIEDLSTRENGMLAFLTSLDTIYGTDENESFTNNIDLGQNVSFNSDNFRENISEDIEMVLSANSIVEEEDNALNLLGQSAMTLWFGPLFSLIGQVNNILTQGLTTGQQNTEQSSATTNPSGTTGTTGTSGTSESNLRPVTPPRTQNRVDTNTNSNNNNTENNNTNTDNNSNNNNTENNNTNTNNNQNTNNSQTNSGGNSNSSTYYPPSNNGNSGSSSNGGASTNTPITGAGTPNENASTTTPSAPESDAGIVDNTGETLDVISIDRDGGKSSANTSSNDGGSVIPTILEVGVAGAAAVAGAKIIHDKKKNESENEYSYEENSTDNDNNFTNLDSYGEDYTADTSITMSPGKYKAGSANNLVLEDAPSNIRIDDSIADIPNQKEELE